MTPALPEKAWIRPPALAAVLAAYAVCGDMEPCGMLLGRFDRGAVRIEEAPAAPNVHPTPDRYFRLAATDQIRIGRDGRERGLSVVGYWHGHLEGPPDPGAGDVEGMAAADALAASPRLMIIVGRGVGRAPVVRAWIRSEFGPREIPLAT